MKKSLLIILALIFTISSLPAQAEEEKSDVILQIAQDVCKEFEKMDLDNISSEEVEKKLTIISGLKILLHADNIKKELNIDVATMSDEEGEKIGGMVGERMIVACPETFTKIVNAMPDDDEEEEEETEIVYIEGKIKKIFKNEFFHIILIDEDGDEWNFTWIYYFDNSEFLNNENYNFEDKKIKMYFKMENAMNPETQEYETINIPVFMEVVY